MVRIDDDDLIRKLLALEGEAWLQHQVTHPDSPYGLHCMLAAWKTRHGPEYASQDMDWRDFLSSGEAVIYGKGGYHRYVVRESGEVCFSKMHARKENVQKALNLGFNLT